jgi:predicted permease
MIVVMALGIGATTGVFSLLDSLVLRSLPVREPERLAYFNRPSFSYPLFREVQARSPHVFSSVVAWNMEREYVEWTGELEPVEILMASGGFYSTLGVQAVVGRTFTPEDDAIGGGPGGLVAVLSHAAWQRRFGGDASVIGRTIRIQRQPFTVVGVTPPGFFGVAPGLAPELTIPLTVLANERRLQSSTGSWVHLLARLRDGVTLQAANAALQTFWPAIMESTTPADLPQERRAVFLSRVATLESARAGYSRVRNQFEEPLWVLLALVGLLLLVATASAANLMLARGAARQREFAVRQAIGAGRRRVVRQVMTEAVVWTVLGGAAGILLATWGHASLVAMMSTWEDPISLDAWPTARVVAFTLSLALVTAAICALIPALRATRVDTGSALKESGQVPGRSIRRWSLGQSLVAVQVALTVLLLFGAALFGRSLQTILSQETGFSAGTLLMVFTDAEAGGYEGERHTAFYKGLQERLAAIPGVESAALSEYPPISDEDGAWTSNVGIDGGPVQREQARQVYFNVVTPGYFRTVGMRVTQGRDFTEADRAGGARVAIVSESLARTYFPGQNALGHRITIGHDKSRRDLEIVGIASDAKYQRLTEGTRSVGYLPAAQLQEVIAGENLVVVIRTAGSLLPVADAIRREVRTMDGRIPLRIQTLRDRIRGSLVRELAISTIAAVLGVLALVLACAGLYGLLAYMVSRQTSEIGLRLALGADRRRMLWMVLRQSLVLAGVGAAIGIAACLALGEFARNLLYQVSATDAIALAAAAGVMLAVALCAAFLPALRAARVDPIVALRSQ